MLENLPRLGCNAACKKLIPEVELIPPDTGYAAKDPAPQGANLLQKKIDVRPDNQLNPTNVTAALTRVNCCLERLRSISIEV